MHREPPRYTAAYSHTEGTMGDDILRLVQWLDLGHPAELSIVASGKQALDENETAQRLIKAGHDQRAIHDRIAKIGSVADFLEWFDATWEEDQSDD